MSKLYRFKLLAGRHIDKTGSYSAIGNDTNNVIVTDVNLAERFNSPGANKFQLLEEFEYEGGLEAYQNSRSPQPTTQVVSQDDGLESLTVEKLRAIADEEEVDIADLKKKDDIIAAIRLARE